MRSGGQKSIPSGAGSAMAGLKGNLMGWLRRIDSARSINTTTGSWPATSGRLKSYQPLESRIGRLCARQELRFVRFGLCKTYMFFVFLAVR